jgi:hypothetical protein
MFNLGGGLPGHTIESKFGFYRLAFNCGRKPISGLHSSVRALVVEVLAVNREVFNEFRWWFRV